MFSSYSRASFVSFTISKHTAWNRNVTISKTYGAEMCAYTWMMEINKTVKSPSWAKLVSRMAYTFFLHLKTSGQGTKDFYSHWLYMENGRIEDTSHANIIIKFFLELLKNKAQLNRLIAKNNTLGVKTVPMNSRILRRLSNTFLTQVYTSKNLNTHVSGRKKPDNASKIRKYNTATWGWIQLTQFNKTIHSKLRRLILGKFQTNINYANYLLMKKHI